MKDTEEQQSEKWDKKNQAIKGAIYGILILTDTEAIC